jgi:Flp pilus assembly protein protease CpaA
MIELLVIIALVGTVLAGLWDLKTTEVPDEIPALMITLGIFVLFIQSTITRDFYPLAVSLVSGTIVLAIGLLLYKKGEWGGADAWIFAGVAYTIPFYNGEIFIVNYFYNFLIVSVFYMIIYSIVVGVLHRESFHYFKEGVAEKWKFVAAPPIVFFFAVGYIISLRGASVFSPYFILSTILIFLLGLFWIYAKAIEKHVFRKRIPTSRLKEGDVVEDMIWRGITMDEISQISKKKKFVVVKEGVRFVPVFAIALVFTLFFGNLLFFIMGLS